jgi:hypothetical protein
VPIGSALRNPLTLNLSLGPLLPLDTHLHCCQTPVLAVVMTLAIHTGAGLGLLVVQDGQDAENHGDAGVELNAHEAVDGGVGNVFKVHRLALDEDSHADDGIEGTGGGGAAGKGG